MTDTLRKAAQDLFDECLASDFNEHWDSYKALRAALAKPVAAQYSDLVSDGGLDPRNASDVAAPQDQDAKDAARYRWLRDKSEPAYFIRMPYNLWDETIDAAIQ